MVRSVSIADMDIGNMAKVPWVLCHSRGMQFVYLGNRINCQVGHFCTFLKDLISALEFKINVFFFHSYFQKILVLYI